MVVKKTWFERCGFTLLEVLVATAVFSIMLVLLLSTTSHASKIWQQAEAQKIRRQTARTLLETISRDLEATTFPLDASATNNLELKLNPASLSGDLKNRDAIFWQAPIPGEGAHGDMHDVGYFVRWLDDGANKRSELCRLRISATNANSFTNAVRQIDSSLLASEAPGSLDSSYKGLLAENVLALWVTLYSSNNVALPGSDFSSRVGERPAWAEIALVVADAQAAKRLTSGDVGVIQGYYTKPTVEDFVSDIQSNSSLAKLRNNVQIFKTRVRLEATK